jgi:hypothetical protein
VFDSSDSSESEAAEEGGGELRGELNDPSEEQERRRTAMAIVGKARYCHGQNNSNGEGECR